MRMRGLRIITTILAAALAVLPSAGQWKDNSIYGDLDDSETVRSFKNHIRTLSSAMMEGRAPGSEGEKMAAEYVEKAFEEAGIDLLSPSGGDVFGIGNGTDTLTSRNVAALIPGYDKSLKGNFIVIGARLDNLGSDTYTVDGETVPRIYYGANGNASGLAMLIELGRMLQTGRLLLNRSVLLVAFGSSGRTLAGSWYFVNRSFPEPGKIDAMVNLDMLGTGYSGFYAFSSVNDDLDAIVNRLATELLPVHPEIVTAEPYSSDHRAFYDKGIPSILFTTGRYPEHGTEKDSESIIDYPSMEKELEYIYNYVVALSAGAKPEFRKERSVKKEASEDIVSFFDCDIKPSFLGSQDPRTFLRKWVYQYLKYPQEAVRNGVQGKVQVDFVVDASGAVKDVRISRSVSPELDAEALRVVGASPKWKPGRFRGKKVSTALTITVEFRLEKKGSKGNFAVNGINVN